MELAEAARFCDVIDRLVTGSCRRFSVAPSVPRKAFTASRAVSIVVRVGVPGDCGSNVTC